MPLPGPGSRQKLIQILYVLGTSVLFGAVAVVAPVLINRLSADQPVETFGAYLGNAWPMLAAVWSAATLVGCCVWLWRNLPAAGPAKTEVTRDELSRFFGAFHSPELKTRVVAGAADSGAGESLQALTDLLLAVGVIRANGGEIKPASEIADSFLCSLSAHLEGGNRFFIGDWSEPRNSPEGLRLVGLLKQIEQFRVATSPDANPPAARSIRAALALIRRDIAAVPHFLMLKNDQFDPAGAWWFVGGSEEAVDRGSLEATLRREITEETTVPPHDILACKEIAPPVKDRRISGRLGVYTEYEYRLFAVQLNQTSPAVQALLVDDPVIDVHYATTTRRHYFAWIKWDELVVLPHLKSNARPVGAALQALSVEQIPRL